MIDPEIQRKKREKFLELLYNESGGNIIYQASMVDLAKKLGLEACESNNIALFLERKGLIEWAAMGYVSITAEGIEEVENALLPEETSHAIFDEETSAIEGNILKKIYDWFVASFNKIVIGVIIGVVVGLILLAIQQYWPDRHTPEKNLDLASNEIQKVSDSIPSDSTNNTNNSIKITFNGNEKLKTEQGNLEVDSVSKAERGNISATRNPEKATVLKKDNLAIPEKAAKPSEEKNDYVILLGRKYPSSAELVSKEVGVEFNKLPTQVAILLEPGLENLQFAEPVDLGKEISSDINFKMFLKSIVEEVQDPILNPDGMLHQRLDPLHRDVLCRFEIQMIKVGEAYYFNHRQLFLGDTIQFRTSKYLYKGIVVHW